MQIAPWLIFASRCAEAIDIYVAAFDANIEHLNVRRRRGIDYVNDARLSLAGGTLYLADGETPTVGQQVTVFADDAFIRQAVRVLSEEGIIVSDPHSASGSSTVVDRFGVRWELFTAPHFSHVVETGLPLAPSSKSSNEHHYFPPAHRHETRIRCPHERPSSAKPSR